jgi:PncC family amidohydrolase
MKLAGQHIVSDQDESLGATVVRHMSERGLTLSGAESCTGGAIAASITAVPGSSAMFMGSLVAYDNQVKQSMLGVFPETLADHGAVSEAVVRQMARGVKERMGTDYAIATSGIAGPSGGSKEKPVGTVWMVLRPNVCTLAIAERETLSEACEKHWHGLSERLNNCDEVLANGWMTGFSFVSLPSEKEHYEPHLSTHR